MPPTEQFENPLEFEANKSSNSSMPKKTSPEEELKDSALGHRIRNKSPEELQAQVAAFAATNLEYRDRAVLFDRLKTLTAGQPDNVSHILGQYDSRYDPSTDTMLEEGDEYTVATAKQFLEYLRLNPAVNNEDIKARQEMLERYALFSSEILILKDELSQLDSPVTHINYLGSGTSSQAFKIEIQGKLYAVRLPNNNKPLISPAQLDINVSGAIKGRGIPHLEQMVALSYADRATISELMPGVPMDKVTIESMVSITDAQLADFAKTLVIAHERGVAIDPKASNFLYDEQEGIGILDYHSNAGVSAYQPTLADTFQGGVSLFAGLGDSPYNVTAETWEEYTYLAKVGIMNAELLGRFKVACNLVLPESQKEGVFEMINENINKLNEYSKNYSNPEYVTNKIREDAEWRKKREQMK